MAKARGSRKGTRKTNLKSVSNTVDRLTKDLKNLRKKPATPARKADVTTLHRKLTAVKKLLAACPESMFRLFSEAKPAAARRKAKTTRRSTRKGTRKR